MKSFGLLIFLTLSLNIWAQENTSPFPLELKDKIPVDKAVTIGKLSNGLTYYIHPNRNPEKYAELKLVVKAGSVQEDDDQQGLAHFLAHLALNGTKNFSQKQLNDFFNSVGVKLAPDSTVAASFEGTIFSIQIPTDSLSLINKSLDILKDWSNNILFDRETINKERKTLIQEWEVGLNTNDQIFRKQIPYLFRNSRYADRITFGKKEVLESFTPETLKSFYTDWYRPDLMAIIVVGDIDKIKTEELIKTKFGDLTNPAKPKAYVDYQIPEHKDTLVSIIADKDITSSTVLIHHEFHSKQDLSVQDLRDKIPSTLFTLMFNQRMADFNMKTEFPMMSGSATNGIFVAGNSIFTLDALGIRDGRITDALEFVLTEFEKAKRFGFSEKELIKAKGSYLRALQFESMERRSYVTTALANKYVQNYILHETIPGIDFEFEFNRKYLQTVTLDEINKLIPSLLPENNLTVTVSMPLNNQFKVPTEADILNTMRRVKEKEIFPNDEEFSKRQLMEIIPAPGSIKNEKELKEIDATELTLSNGVKVIYKQTTFKLDEILVLATSPGGYSLVNDREFNSVRGSAEIIANSGVGTFSSVDLRRYLSGKKVSLFPYIDNLSEGIKGHCSPFDFETMMKLIHVYFTSPRKNATDFESFKTNTSTSLTRQNLLPENLLRDSIDALLYKHNPRFTRINKAILEKLDLEKSISFYKERFADASNFTFFFIGTFTKADIKNLVEKYLASLPSIGKKERWKENNLELAQKAERKIYSGNTNKSIIELVYHTNFKYSFQNCIELNSFQKIINDQLHQRIEVHKNSISDLNVEVEPVHFPKPRVVTRIKFSCSADKVDETTQMITSTLDSLKQFGVQKKVVDDTKQNLVKEFQNNISQNQYWLQTISSAYINGTDPKLISSTESILTKLSPATIKKWAKEIFGKDNVIKVTLFPEAKK